MPETARDIVEGAYKLIGVKGRGMNLNATDANDGFIALNELLAVLSVERLAIPVLSKITGLTLSVGVDTYTVGTGLDLNTSEPIAIEQLVVTDSAGAKHILFQKKLADYLTYQNMASGLPEIFFYVPGVLRIGPAPDQAYAVDMWCNKGLTALVDLSSNLGFGDAFHPYLKHALAIMLAGPNGKTPKQSVGDAYNKFRLAVEMHLWRNEPMMSELAPVTPVMIP